MVTRRDLIKFAVGSLSASWASTSLARVGPEQSSYTVFNPLTGQPVLGRHEDRQDHPASLTKLMAAELIMGALKNPNLKFSLDTMIKIPEYINEIPEGIRVIRELKPDREVKAEKLLVGMGGYSDARSTLALALHVAGANCYGWAKTDKDGYNAFVENMNIRAAQIGMKHSKFSVITGMPSLNHYSTPNDMALLASHLQKQYPDLSELCFGQAELSLKGTYHHTSSFIRKHVNSFIWAKTGWTNDAGFCLANYNVKNGVPLIGVVMGEKNDYRRNKLMDSIIRQGYELSKKGILVPKPV